MAVSELMNPKVITKFEKNNQGRSDGKDFVHSSPNMCMCVHLHTNTYYCPRSSISVTAGIIKQFIFETIVWIIIVYFKIYLSVFIR